MTKVVIEPLYQSKTDEAGNISIALLFHDGKPEAPRLLFDGNKTALLYRSENQVIALTDIDDKTSAGLKDAKEVTLSEPKTDLKKTQDLRQIISGGYWIYKAPVRVVKRLPIEAALLRSDDDLAKLVKSLSAEELNDLKSQADRMVNENKDLLEE